MLKNVTYILELAIKFEKSNYKRFAVEVNGYSLTTCFFKDFDCQFQVAVKNDVGLKIPFRERLN